MPYLSAYSSGSQPGENSPLGGNWDILGEFEKFTNFDEGFLSSCKLHVYIYVSINLYLSSFI